MAIPEQFNSELQYYLSEDRKNVYDDPTLQPWIDALQSEAQESYDRSTYGLHDQAARESLLGTGYYGGMMIGANEEYNEAIQKQLADVYQTRFSNVEQNELAALGLLNQRDMNAAQARAQVAAARASAAPGLAGVRLQRQQWVANQPYTDLERTIGIMGGLNQLGGYTTSPNYVRQATPYYGPSPLAAGVMGGIGGALQGYGMANTWGLT